MLRHAVQQPRVQGDRLGEGLGAGGGAHGRLRGGEAAHRRRHEPVPGADQGAALQPGAALLAVRARGVHLQPPGGQAGVE